MALRWTDSPTSSPPNPPPALQMTSLAKIPKPACEKGEKVFVLGWGEFSTKPKATSKPVSKLPSTPNSDTNTDQQSQEPQPGVLCEVIDWGYRLPAHKHCYFLKVVQQDYAEPISFMCNLEHLLIPKYQPGRTLEVRDSDDRVNGVGLSSERQVLLELVELKEGKIKYWIKAPPISTTPGKGKGKGKDGSGKKEKKAKWIDIEEDKLERMVNAAIKAKEQAAAAKAKEHRASVKVQNSFSVRNDRDHARFI